MRRALLFALCAVGASAAAAPAATAATPPYDAIAVKSALVGKIAGFIRWPAGAGLEDPNRPFEIVVLGETPLTQTLRTFYQRKRIAGHNVFVRAASEAKEIGRPHVLFVPAAARARLAAALDAVKAAPVLTIGDGAGFGALGVAVNLVEEANRLRFEISRRALRRHRLEASYQLLQLARLVDDGHEADDGDDDTGRNRER